MKLILLLAVSMFTATTFAQSKAAPLKLQYLYASNAGMMGFYSDGSVRSCGRCEFDKSNVSKMATQKSSAKYKVVNNVIVFNSKSGKQEFPFYVDEDAKEMDTDWMMFNFKWLQKP